MPLPLVQAIAPAILILSLGAPILVGFLGKPLRFSVLLGWVLFVASFLFQDFFALLLANHSHDTDGVRAVAIEQPGTIAAVMAGWLPPLVGHFLGRGAGTLLKPFSDRHPENKGE